jgi:hypothetical protein
VTIDDMIRDEALRQRIRETLGEPARPSGWSRLLKHPISSLLLGFALTGLVGTWLSSSYQERAEENKRLAERREARRTAATEVFRDLGRVLDARLYAMERLHQSVSRRYADQRSRDSVYSRLSEEWYATLPTRTALVCRYFGVEPARQLNAIAGQFSAARTTFKADQQQGIDATGRLRYRIYQLELSLVDVLQRGRLVEDDSATTNCASLLVPVPAER